MKLLDKILYIEFSELVAAGVSEQTISLAKHRNSPSWSFIDDPADRRRVLIQYEKLKQQYKDMVIAKFGDPYKLITSILVKQYLINKAEDIEFINKYRLPDGSHLPEKHKSEYIAALKYLNLLAISSPKTVKKQGFFTMKAFTEAVQQMIKAENLPLPLHYQKLKAKVKQYKSEGPSCIINKRFGNTNSRKLEATQIALIAQLYGLANQFSAERVTFEYNLIAAEKGWPTVTVEAIKYHLNKPEYKQQLVGPRKGVSEFREAADFVVHRVRPSRPNMLWVGDGTPFELYYQERVNNAKGHSVVKHWMRKYIYVVIDAFNDVVMGYAIGDTENMELAKLAWKMACTTHGVLPQQVKTDHFGLKELAPFYGKIALNSNYFTPSAVGNARDKVVEQFFAKLNNEVVRVNYNYSGANIRAKNQPNRDYLDKIKNSFPDEAGCIQQIHACIDMWNNSTRMGTSRSQAWINGDHAQDRALTDEQRLEIFGIRHPHTNRLTNKGITVTIEGVTRKYMLLDHSFADTIGTDYQVIYDNHDLSKILVVGPDGRLKYVVPEFEPIPMAYGDMKQGDRIRLNSVLEYKKERFTINMQRNQAQRELLEAEGLLKGHFIQHGTNKDALNNAAATLKAIDEAPLINAREDEDDATLVMVKRKEDDKDVWDE